MNEVLDSVTDESIRAQVAEIAAELGPKAEGSEVRARLLPLEKAITQRLDQALQVLTAASLIEKAYAEELAASHLGRLHTYERTAVARTGSYAQKWGAAHDWRRARVRAGLLDAKGE
jgi:hypothetical protein